MGKQAEQAGGHEDGAFAAALLAMARRRDPAVTAIEGIARVSAGATLETWALDAVRADGSVPLILRRSPGNRAGTSVTLDCEAEVLRAVGAAGLAVPEVWHVLTAEDGLGEGFLMRRIAGETVPRRIIRAVEASGTGERLVAQLGDALALLHATPPEGLPPLVTTDARTALDQLEEGMSRPGAQPRPVFELALRWLRRRLPDPVTPALVHGDFRNGNIIVGPDGLGAILDWEIVHWGDPAEDLAWIELPPWRFGILEKPVGGLGSRNSFHAAYAARSGRPIDPARVDFWRILGSLRWGIGTAAMIEWFHGHDPSVERAMIARRASENEMDLMRAITGRE